MRERVQLDKIPRIDADEAHRMCETDSSVLFVDVRDLEEYDESHIQNAVSLPLRELRSRYAELPHGVLLVTY